MNNELEQLCNCLLDDSLNKAQHQRLEDILRDDRQARERFRNYMKLHAVIRREYSALAAELEQAHAKQPRPWPWAIIVRTTMAALLMALVMVGIIYSDKTNSSKNTLSLVALTNGDLMWSSDPSNRRSLKIGDQVTAGLLQLDGEAANAVLMFTDGTNLRLSGHAEIEFNEQAQKNVLLKSGIFYADVSPQPAGFPMIITTPTAQLQILGTVFSVSADETSTALNVESGHVRMQRLVDGQSVDVTTQQSAIASGNTANELSKQQRVRPLDNWKSQYSHEPPSYCKGLWIPPTEQQRGFIRSVLLRSGKNSEGIPISLYGVTMRSPLRREKPFVHVTPTSVVTMRYRTNITSPPSVVKVFFSTHRINGAFGGNFEYAFNPSHGAASDDGWRTISFPTASALPVTPEKNQFMSNVDIVLTMPFTVNEKSQLEVAHIEFNSTPVK